MTRKVLRRSLLFLLIAVVGYGIYLYVPREDYFVERIGTIEDVERSRAASENPVDETIRLRSTTGLVVDMRIVRPATERALPVVVLAGGHETGMNAVELAGRPDDMAFVAISYPYRGSHDPQGVWESLQTVPHIQDTFLDTAPALALAGRWLATEPWVDPARIELVGASLGVPFAAVAGAIEDSYSRTWLLHGGGDNVSWVSHLGRRHIPNETLRRLVARFALLVTHGFSFDTPEWLARIAPRPVVVVMACEDDYTPPEAQAPLIEAALAAEHATLRWTSGRHIKSGRDDVLGQLLGIVLGGVAGGTVGGKEGCEQAGVAAATAAPN